MKSKLIIVTLLFFFLISCSTRNSNSEAVTETPEKEMTKEYITTFQIDQPDKINIESYDKMSAQYDSTLTPKRTEVTDASTITRILKLIKALPDKGEIMKKMGDVPLLEVRLTYKEKVLYFDYYSESVKTPDTSFYTNPPAEEKQLFDLLNTLLTR